MQKYEIHISRREVLIGGLILFILVVFFFLMYFVSFLYGSSITGHVVDVGLRGDVVGSNFEARVNTEGVFHWSDLVILVPAAIFVLSFSYLIITLGVYLLRRNR